MAKRRACADSLIRSTAESEARVSASSRADLPGNWELEVGSSPRRRHTGEPLEAEGANVLHVVAVPFVAGMLPGFLAASAPKRQPHLPRLREDGGIVDRDFV